MKCLLYMHINVDRVESLHRSRLRSVASASKSSLESSEARMRDLISCRRGRKASAVGPSLVPPISKYMPNIVRDQLEISLDWSGLFYV